MSEKQPYTILFIEDEIEIRKNYTKYLERHYAHVYEAGDGEIGYKIYKDKKPDIIILDIHLPLLSGLELLKKIRITDPEVKVIMLTAFSDKKYLLEATELKLVKYLVKPITRDDLKLALDRAVEEFSKFKVVSKKVLNIKDGCMWDFETEVFTSNSVEIPLTNKEKQIVGLLLSYPNNVFTYDEIILHVWDSFEDDKLDSLKTIVKNIRKKLPKEIIKNVFGRGYKY